MKRFNAYSDYYELLYRDKDYAQEAEYVSALLTEHNIPASEILELGSGTGIHGRLLGQMGYKVTGIELSSEMISHAKITENFTCEQGDIRNISLGRQFGAVISLFHVLSYQTGNFDVESVFQRAAEHLQPGGLFLFDVWYSPAVGYQPPEVRVKRISDGDLSVTRIAEPTIYPNQNRVDVNYTIIVENKAKGATETISETHPMRHFSLPELDLLASFYGFKRVHEAEFVTGNAAGVNTWAICVVLKRN